MQAQPHPQPTRSQHPHHPQQPPQPPRSRRDAPPRRRPIPWWIVAGMTAAAAIVVLSMFVLLVVVLYPSEDRIASGVAVAGVPVGGETSSSAAAALQQAGFASQPVVLTDGDRRWSVPLGELGVQVDIDSTVQLAHDAPAGTNVQPWYTIDFTQTQNALVALSSQVNISAIPGQAGRSIDIPVVLNRLYINLSGELSDGVIELSMIVVEPPQAQPSAGNYTGQTSTHIVEQGQELALIAELYDVSMQDIVAINQLENPDLLFIGQELTIPAAGLYTPTAAEAPAAPLASGKAIVVSTIDQRIYAYENGQLIHSHLVSTGLPDTPTVLGDYRIYKKYEKTNMSGPDYFLPDVPYTMYFYQGYGIHGTYWHNSFGRPMSHGCVNLPTPEAQWFFNWAEEGTLVRVI
ncbi:MAG: L,D-transpeptidase family protein [Chloroflexi bacterium]|nr:L,D-transpeptidase family protein [Chloroflexota bacterium]